MIYQTNAIRVRQLAVANGCAGTSYGLKSGLSVCHKSIFYQKG